MAPGEASFDRNDVGQRFTGKCGGARDHHPPSRFAQGHNRATIISLRTRVADVLLRDSSPLMRATPLSARPGHVPHPAAVRIHLPFADPSVSKPRTLGRRCAMSCFMIPISQAARQARHHKDLCANLRRVRDLSAAWRDDRNHHRPHASPRRSHPVGASPAVGSGPRPELRDLSNAGCLGRRSPCMKEQFRRLRRPAGSAQNFRTSE